MAAASLQSTIPMLDLLNPGDLAAVAMYYPPAYSFRNLFGLVEGIKDRGAGFPPLAEDIERAMSVGGGIFHLFAAIRHRHYRLSAQT